MNHFAVPNFFQEDATVQPKLKEGVPPERKKLSVFGYREQILNMFETEQVILVCGETGSGKTMGIFTKSSSF